MGKREAGLKSGEERRGAEKERKGNWGKKMRGKGREEGGEKRRVKMERGSGGGIGRVRAAHGYCDYPPCSPHINSPAEGGHHHEEGDGADDAHEADSGIQTKP